MHQAALKQHLITNFESNSQTLPSHCTADATCWTDCENDCVGTIVPKDLTNMLSLPTSKAVVGTDGRKAEAVAVVSEPQCLPLRSLRSFSQFYSQVITSELNIVCQTKGC